MLRKKLLLFSGIIYAIVGLHQTSTFLNVDNKLRENLADIGGTASFILPEGKSLDEFPQDLGNELSQAKVSLGKMLFHETALGSKPLIPEGKLKRTYSCSSCHHVASGFQTGARQAIGDGGSGFGLKGEVRTRHPDYRVRELDVQMRKSPSVLNSAYQRVMFWDGQFGAKDLNIGTETEWKEGTPMIVNLLGFEGLESQAIAGLEVHRMGLSEDFFDSYPAYKSMFDDAFPELDSAERYTDRSVGLAIAAYERTLVANQAPFQKWLKGDNSAMSLREKKGALLFFGKAGCGNCHTGPALSGPGFHALGMGELKGEDTYQTRGIKNERLGRGGFTKKAEDMYKFKTPQLYNLVDASFFGHGATFKSIREVVEYINAGIPQNEEIHSDQLSPLFKPLNLTRREIKLLTLFLSRSLYDDNLIRYVPSTVPSGRPFPVSDAESVRSGVLHGR